jgi:hypothetical protein
MKYIITENQYRILLKEDRVAFLKTQNVIDPKLLDDLTKGNLEKKSKRPDGGMEPNKIKVEPIENHEGIDIAYIVTNNKGKQSVKLSDEIFEDIVEADPSRNKQYVQWMIQVFLRHISDGDIEQAIRFLTEDLPEASEFLTIFDDVKNKKVFKRSAPNRPNAPQNVTDINQYTSLAQLYSVVSPFIGASDEESEDGESPLWKKLKKYIDLGEAKLVYRDGDVLIYSPLTIESSCDPLGPLASWCTRREGNTYFDSYRRNNPKPDGSVSDYYVIMPKNLFNGDDEGNTYPLQFHFESNQLHDKNNSSIERSSKLSEVLSRFPGMREFFKKELGKLVEMDVVKGTGLMDSAYIKYLNMFGGRAEEVISGEVYQKGVENIKKMASQQKVPLQQNKYLKWLMENTENVEILDYLDPDVTESLDFSNMNLGKLPNMSKFLKVDRITANNCNLKTLPTVDMLPDGGRNINVLSFNDNQITKAPLDGYDTLKECFMITLLNNPIKEINVPVLTKMIEEEPQTFIRFGLNSDVINNLSPKNVKEFQNLIDGVGGAITFR